MPAQIDKIIILCYYTAFTLSYWFYTDKLNVNRKLSIITCLFVSSFLERSIDVTVLKSHIKQAFGERDMTYVTVGCVYFQIALCTSPDYCKRYFEVQARNVLHAQSADFECSFLCAYKTHTQDISSQHLCTRITCDILSPTTKLSSFSKTYLTSFRIKMFS